MSLKILCNVSTWNNDLIQIIANQFGSDLSITKISNNANIDKTKVKDYFVENLSQNRDNLNKIGDENLIQRDRLLRVQNIYESKKVIQSMRDSIVKFLDENEFDILITESVDNFFHNILVEESIKRNLCVISPLLTFLNGYFRLSIFGEKYNLNEPSLDEVKNASSELLKDKYTSYYLEKNYGKTFSTYFKNWLKNNLRYYFLRMKSFFDGKKYIYHNKTYKSVDFYSRNIFFKIPFEDNNWKFKMRTDTKYIIYFPLQYYPEMTIDYWTKDVKIIDYLSSSIKILKKLSQDFKIIIKEHPNCLGSRKNNFYDQILKEIPEIIFIPTNVHSNECLKFCDAILTYTGTAGFEGLLRGKVLLTLSSPYYCYGKRFKKINLLTKNSEIIKLIEKNNKNPILKDEQNKLIKNLLKGFLKGTFRNLGDFNSNNEKHLLEAIELGKTLKNVYDNKKEYLLSKQKDLV